MRFLPITTRILIITGLAWLPAAAQDLVAEEPDEIRRFTVEVIIFRYAENVSVGSEVFAADLPDPDMLAPDDGVEEAGEELVFDDTANLSDEPVAEENLLPDPELVLLAPEEYQLDTVMEHLRRLDVYEPLMHFGWTQAAWPEEETLPLELFSFAPPPPGLDGTLALYLSRYLHLVVDLALDAPENAPDASDPMQTYGDYRTLNDFGTPAEVGPVRYRIQENRILKNGDLRYFDHPKFGVLAKVTRIEEEDLPPDEETELLGYPGE